MFFEGAEKKAEIQVHGERLSLLKDIPNEFWYELVTKCAAKVLSTIKNEKCIAFLLSESSLFVWDDRFLLLTCGETKTVNSVEFFIQQYGKDVIKQLTYQRKNEYFSHAQPSCFSDDVDILNNYLNGQAYRFGALDGHHNFIFHYENNFTVDNNEKTYEFLAYQISEHASRTLTTPNLSNEDIRKLFKLDDLIPGFDIDDFVFEPFGYSLNAIKGNKYLTIHVTPQEASSYVSFEANIDLVALATHILDVLSPRSFDLLTYNEYSFDQKVSEHIPKDFVASSNVEHVLSNGYLVRFCNFLLPAGTITEPVQVSLLGDNHVL